MKLNEDKWISEDKCLSGHKFEHVWADIGNVRVWERQHHKLLGVSIDKNLKFNNYLIDICMKAGMEINSSRTVKQITSF